MAIIITGGTNNAVVAAVTGGRHAICQRRLRMRVSFMSKPDTIITHNRGYLLVLLRVAGPWAKSYSLATLRVSARYVLRE